MARERTTKELVVHIHRLLHDKHHGLEAITERDQHNHELLHKILERMERIMTQAEDLTREIQETRDAVGVVAARMQELIDQLASQPALTAAAQAAVDGLNDIQTQLAAMAAPATPPTP